MNAKDKLLLKIMDTVLSSGSYKYTYLDQEIIDYIQNKYTKRYNIFHIKGKNFIDGRERGKIFLIGKEKLVLTKEGEEHNQKIAEARNRGDYEDNLDMDLNDYEDNSKYVVGLGELGHSIYDRLKQQWSNEVTQQTMTKQTEIIENQQSALNNTFWVSFLIAFVMGFDLILRFIESRLEITLFSNIILGLLLLILVYIFLFIYHQFEGLNVKLKGTRTVIIYIFAFVLLIGGIIFSGYSQGQIAWKDESLSKKQEEFFSKQIGAISPVTPEIEVKLDFPKDKEIAVWQIANIKEYEDGNQDFDKYKIRFILSNIGQKNSGVINAILESSFTNEARAFLKDVSNEEPEYAVFDIWYEKCEKDFEKHILKNGTEIQKSVVNEDCDHEVSEIPLGWQEFNLTIDCNWCMEEPKIYPLYFCIYEDTKESRKVCEEKR